MIVWRKRGASEQEKYNTSTIYTVKFYYPYWFAAIFPEKNGIFRPFTVVNHYDRSDFTIAVVIYYP